MLGTHSLANPGVGSIARGNRAAVDHSIRGLLYVKFGDPPPGSSLGSARGSHRSLAAEKGLSALASGSTSVSSGPLSRPAVVFVAACDGVMPSLGASSPQLSRVCCQSLSAIGRGSIWTLPHHAASSP